MWPAHVRADPEAPEFVSEFSSVLICLFCHLHSPFSLEVTHFAADPMLSGCLCAVSESVILTLEEANLRTLTCSQPPAGKM